MDILMSKNLIIVLSILIAVVGYKTAECRKCRHEAILFGLIFLQFRNYGTLGLKCLIYFIVGECLINYYDKHRRQ